MENFEKTKKLIEQYREFDKRMEGKDSEMKRIDLSIERINEESGKIILEDYEENENSQLNEAYKREIMQEYDKRKKELNKEKEQIRKEKENIEKDKKYFRTDANLKTITMEIMDIDKEIRSQELKLKENELEIQKFNSEEQHENPLKWMELYKEKDEIKKTIEELNNKKTEYANFLQELKSIELTPEEYKEMFAREAEKNKEPEKTEPEKKEPEKKETEQTENVNVEPKKESNQILNNEIKVIPEIIIGRKVSIKNGDNISNIDKLSKLLKYNHDELLEDIQEAFKDNPEMLPKDIEEKMNNMDPVLMQGILEAWDTQLIDDSQVQKAIMGVINKDKNALKDVIKIKYDKEDLSKWAFLPWNKANRDVMAQFADDNKEIAEVVGEYEPNPFKRLMKKVNTKLLGNGKQEKESESPEINKVDKEEPKSWELTDKQKEEANSRDNIGSNEQSENKVEKEKEDVR